MWFSAISSTSAGHRGLRCCHFSVTVPTRPGSSKAGVRDEGPTAVSRCTQVRYHLSGPGGGGGYQRYGHALVSHTRGSSGSPKWVSALEA